MATTTDNSTTFTVVAGALAVAILATAGILYLSSSSRGGAANGTNAAIAALSQSIPRNASAALNGRPGAFDRMASDLNRLASSGVGGNAWNSLRQHAGTMIDQRASVETITAAAASAIC